MVARRGVDRLLKGLERLRVVSIGLGETEDPQQIFESLNATGRPLTESEKVKNWLLMGLRDEEQQELHDDYWRTIERLLGAEHTTGPIDIFLRDFLRWRTGELHGIDRVHDGFRRWAVRQRLGEDRPALCRDLTRLARLYGIVTGAAGEYHDARVERELRHLRAMGIDIHRPLTLRLLNDVSEIGPADAELATVLAGIGTWITRLWLADRATSGMNRAVVDLAVGRGPGDGEDFAEHWLERIRGLRNTRVRVPSDEDIREGVRTRKAYGGAATRSSFAVLCALMESEHREEAPARDRLTIEHVMPQKLTDDWRDSLGDEADEKHGRYRDKLANLTLSGDHTNSSLAARPFAEKREVYRKSPIGMARRLAAENEWDVGALERREDEIARLVLDRWPWADQAVAPKSGSVFRWRIENGPWHSEIVASQMVLNVAGALLSLDPGNVEKLSGRGIGSNLHSAERYPPDRWQGARMMRAVTGHHRYVMSPYARHHPASAERCRRMGARCGVSVEVEFDPTSQIQSFWRVLKDMGGVPGQKDSWRGQSQLTSPVNSSGDRVGISAGQEILSLYIWAERDEGSNDGVARVRRYCWMIREQMGDQELGGELEKRSEDGKTITVQRPWTHDDEGEWREAARWIIEQYERLAIMAAEEE